MKRTRVIVNWSRRGFLGATAALITLLLLAPSAFGEELEPGLRAAIDAAVRAEMEQQEAVGVAVGVIEGGVVVYCAGYGWADRENEIPVTTGTLFRWASVSKPLTAVAAMQLVEAGRLDLDADVRTLVPEFPDHGAAVTTRQLLGHLGGIVHYSNGPVVRTQREYAEEHPFESVINALDLFKESPLVAAPGEAFAYTTHGFILASAAVERAGGDPFARQVHNRIAEPLGMTTLRPDYQWEKIDGRAKGYKRVLGAIVPSTDTDVSWKLGGGGWISSIEDMAKFAAGLMHDELMKPETRRQMWTEGVTTAGERTGYALGFAIGEQGGTPRITHTGSQEKTRTRLVIYPERGHGMVVMTNAEYADPGAFSTAVYAAMKAWRQTQAATPAGIP